MSTISMDELKISLMRLNSDGIRSFLVTFEKETIIEFLNYLGDSDAQTIRETKDELISDILYRLLYPEVKLNFDMVLRIQPAKPESLVNKEYYYEICVNNHDDRSEVIEGIKSQNFSTCLEALQKGKHAMLDLAKKQMDKQSKGVA